MKPRLSFGRARKAYVKLLGPDHPYAASARHNLAVIFFRRGDYAAAEQLDRQVLESLRRSVGEMHPQVAMSLWALARVRELQGDSVTAEQYFREAVAVQRAVGPTSPDFAGLLHQFSGFLNKKGELREAESLEREAKTLENQNH